MCDLGSSARRGVVAATLVPPSRARRLSERPRRRGGRRVDTAPTQFHPRARAPGAARIPSRKTPVPIRPGAGLRRPADAEGSSRRRVKCTFHVTGTTRSTRRPKIPIQTTRNAQARRHVNRRRGGLRRGSQSYRGPSWRAPARAPALAAAATHRTARPRTRRVARPPSRRSPRSESRPPTWTPRRPARCGRTARGGRCPSLPRT